MANDEVRTARNDPGADRVDAMSGVAGKREMRRPRGGVGADEKIAQWSLRTASTLSGIH